MELITTIETYTHIRIHTHTHTHKHTNTNGFTPKMRHPPIFTIIASTSVPSTHKKDDSQRFKNMRTPCVATLKLCLLSQLSPLHTSQAVAALTRQRGLHCNQCLLFSSYSDHRPEQSSYSHLWLVQKISFINLSRYNQIFRPRSFFINF